MRISVRDFFNTPFIASRMIPVQLTKRIPVKRSKNTRSLKALASDEKSIGGECLREFTLDKSSSDFRHWRFRLERGCTLSDGKDLYEVTSIVYSEYPKIPTVTARKIGPIPKMPHPQQYFRAHPELCERLIPIQIRAKAPNSKGAFRHMQVNCLAIDSRKTPDGIIIRVQLDRTKSQFDCRHFLLTPGCIMSMEDSEYVCIDIHYPKPPRFPIITMRKL